MSVNTINELIQLLEEARDDMGGETEVRVAYQENYPLSGTVANVMVPEQPDNEPHCEEHISYSRNCSECRSAHEQAVADGWDPDDPETWEMGDTVETKRRKQLWIAVGSQHYDENPYGPRWAWGY